MHWFDTFGMLLAQADAATKTPWYEQTWVSALALLGVIAVSFVIGRFFAQAVRMMDYWWRVGLILSTIGCAILIVATGWPPKLGVDLKGGVTLIYQLADMPEEDRGQGKRQVLDALIPKLKDRLNPGGTKEIIIRPLGQDQVEIIIPDVTADEVEEIQRLITKAGLLKFRIVANRRDHEQEIELAERQSRNPTLRLSKDVFDVRERNAKGRPFLDENGKPESRKVVVARWARIDREEAGKAELPVKSFKDPNGNEISKILPYGTDVSRDVIRDADTGEFINIEFSEFDPAYAEVGAENKNVQFEQWLLKNGHRDIEVLMWTYDGWDVEGKDLGFVRKGMDRMGKASVNFTMVGSGADRMGGLTGLHLPDRVSGHSSRLGIVLDDELISAPEIRGTITTDGEITGNFTDKEVEFLVGILRAGRLPAALKEQPLSIEETDSYLGRELAESGLFAIGISLVAVIVFMIFYYRFSGIVACFALLGNLVLIVALFMLVKQPFTLTGLAGLVLTVGMSVDANVLVFERIREELNRGSALRMAIRNGFSKATTTIVDANLTTLITAIVLYAIGTDQIRGFAVALILGILMSMYTAIFCSRVIFDVAERQRWISRLGMMRILGATHIDFIGKRRIAIAGSVILILIGLVAVFFRGGGIFAIDLAGGSSVRIVLAEPMKVDEVRAQMSKVFDPMRIDGSKVSFTVSEITFNDIVLSKDFPNGTVYRIDTSIPTSDPGEDEARKKAGKEPFPKLTEIVKKVFQDDQGNSLLAVRSMDFEAPRAVAQAGTQPRPPSAVSPESGESGQPANGGATTNENTTNGDKPTDNASGSNTEQPSDSGETDSTQPKTESTDGAAIGPLPDSTLAFADDVALRLLQADSDEPAAPEAESEAEADSNDTAESSEPVKDTTEPAATEETPTAEPATTNEAATTNESAATTDEPATTEEPATTTDAPAKTDQPETFNGGGQRVVVKTELRFKYEIVREALTRDLINAANDAGAPLQEAQLKLDPKDTENQGTLGNKVWSLELTVAKVADAERILKRLQSDLSGEPYFRGESGVGSQLAGDTQIRALAALLVSLLGIVVYIWIRFQKVVFGLAAVLALVHDVLVVLGAIAVSYWLAGIFGFLLIDEFKISLPVVAAFLTIIGYSLNDTIVIFDRIREVRGKSPDLTSEMLNVSIGQTLSRTLLTSLTTLIVVVILYALGGEAIHGFAFALVVGVVAGTYSTIFIASPALLWLVHWQSAPQKPKQLAEKVA